MERTGIISRTFVFAAVFMAFWISIPAVMTGSVLAAGSQEKTNLRIVDKQFVCMVNDARFSHPQIAVKVDGKTYYGCCPMCEEILENDAEMRTATDPVSGKKVNKAEAVIGADETGKAYYFENVENLENFTP